MPFVKLTVMLCVFVTSASGNEPESNLQDECTRFAYEYRIMESLINLKNENERLSRKIESLESIQQKPPIILSHVRLSKSTVLSGNQRVMYDVLVSNIGKAWDLDKSQFTAPIPGLYQIHLTACMGSGGPWADFDIIKDGVVMSRILVGDDSYHSCASDTAFLLLEADDNVWVERSAGHGNPNEEHGWNTFAVTLLRKI